MECKRSDFQLSEEYTFLNCAYLSPQMKAVEAVGIEAIRMKNQPHRIFPEDFFREVEGVKAEFARIINAPEPGRIAILPSASYGIATVAKNAPVAEGQEIITVKDQFPSNYYSWKRLANARGASLKTIGVQEGKDKGLRWNTALLEAISPKTAVVAIAHIHWAEGLLFDLEAISKKCKEVNAWLVVDGTQSVGALPLDIQKIQPDALICAAYKWLMGPYATGVAYYGPKLDNGIPIEENWINRKNSQNFKGLVNYQDEYQPLAARYSVGEQSNFALIPMLKVALQQLNTWGIDNIQQYCQQLNQPYLEELNNLGFSILPVGQRAHHLLGLQLPSQVDSETLQQQLASHKILVSFRGKSIRVAPNVYNNAGDWNRLMSVLRKVASAS